MMKAVPQLFTESASETCELLSAAVVLYFINRVLPLEHSGILVLSTRQKPVWKLIN